MPLSGVLTGHQLWRRQHSFHRPARRTLVLVQHSQSNRSGTTFTATCSSVTEGSVSSYSSSSSTCPSVPALAGSSSGSGTMGESAVTASTTNTCVNSHSYAPDHSQSSLAPARSLLSHTLTNKHKSVMFSGRVNVVLIPCISEYEAAGLADRMWWTDDDYKLFKQCALEEVKEFMFQANIADSKEAIRQLYQSSDRSTFHNGHVCGDTSSGDNGSSVQITSSGAGAMGTVSISAASARDIDPSFSTIAEDESHHHSPSSETKTQDSRQLPSCHGLASATPSVKSGKSHNPEEPSFFEANDSPEHVRHHMHLVQPHSASAQSELALLQQRQQQHQGPAAAAIAMLTANSLPIYMKSPAMMSGRPQIAEEMIGLTSSSTRSQSLSSSSATMTSLSMSVPNGSSGLATAAATAAAGSGTGAGAQGRGFGGATTNPTTANVSASAAQYTARDQVHPLALICS